MNFDPNQPAAQVDPPPSGESSIGARRLTIPVWLLAGLLGLVTVVLYWPATRHDFINYDDDLYVTANIHVQNGLTLTDIKWAFGHLVSGNWHPLTMISHMLDCQLFGLDPWGHHLSSLLLHAVNTVLVLVLLHRLTGALWRSALVAALFGWHPMHVESVAWVAERKDVLSTTCGFLALLFYVSYAKGVGSESRTPLHGYFPSSAEYWLSWLWLALGLLCKPMLVTWPFVLLLLDYWPLRRFQSGRFWPLAREKIPFLALAAAAGVMTLLVQAHAGAVVAMEKLPLAIRCENSLIAYGRYISKLLWPDKLAVFYPLQLNWSHSHLFLTGISLGGLTVLLFLNRRQNPFLLFGWLWFIGTLVPVIGLVQVGDQAMADRYTYIPSVGFFLMVVWGAYDLTRGWRCQPLGLAVVGLATAGLCLMLTRQQLGYWQDSETLFRHTVAVTTNNYIAHSNLGNALFVAGDTDAAISEYKEVVRLNPHYAKVYNNLGVALAKQGRSDEAISQFQAALRLNPNYPNACNNLGIALAGEGRLDEAIGQFQKAIQLNPDYLDAGKNLQIARREKAQADALASHLRNPQH